MGASHQGLGIQSTVFEKIAKIKSEPLEVIFEESCQLNDILGPEKKPKNSQGKEQINKKF